MIEEGPLSKKSQNENVNLMLLFVPDGMTWKACASQNHILVGSRTPPLHVQRVLISVL